MTSVAEKVSAAAAPATPPTAALPTLPSPQPENPRPRWITRLDAIFVLTVVLPTLLAAVYYGVIASDRYVSESRFVVRSPQRANPSGLGALLQGTVFSRSADDTYSVHDYMRSRDALRELDEKLQVRKHFESPFIDAFNRFPGLDRDQSFEALHRYYEDHVRIDYDTVSSITTLKVTAYSAEDARRINDLLLQMGERLVNNLNIRSRQDLIQVAEKEVAVAEERAKTLAQQLSGFRAGRGVFDPTVQSAAQLQGIAKLQDDLLTSQAQLAQLRRVAPSNPQVGSLVAQIEVIERAIATETSKVIGRSGSLAAKSPDYDRIVLERQFAERQLAGALAALDTARNEAARKQLYLERLVQPSLPDVAVEPRRLRSTLTVLAIGLVLWGIVSLVVASIREHAD